MVLQYAFPHNSKRACILELEVQYQFLIMILYHYCTIYVNTVLLASCQLVVLVYLR